MNKYNCDKCGKYFSQKSHYTIHMNKKKPCIIESLYNNKLVKDMNYKKISIPKPILKWVGGKTQILDKLIVEFPTEINNYHEKLKFLFITNFIYNSAVVDFFNK